MRHLGREYLLDNFAFHEKGEVISLPFLIFLDGFGIFRNNFRTLLAFYLTPANLSFEDRRKVANVFTLALGPYNSEMIQELLKTTAEEFKANIKAKPAHERTEAEKAHLAWFEANPSNAGLLSTLWVCTDATV